VLFIHIPKTGGTSIEKYFYNKYELEKNDSTLYSSYKKIHGSTLQHQLYKNVIIDKQVTLQEENLRIFAAVRHPYDRIMSDLFFFKLVKPDMSKEEVEPILLDYIHHSKGKNKVDGHARPQWQYVASVDDDNVIAPNICLIRTESLKDDMVQLGFTDFNITANVTKNRAASYLTYLTEHAKREINQVYAKDFEWFNYQPAQVVGETKPAVSVVVKSSGIVCPTPTPIPAYAAQYLHQVLPETPAFKPVATTQPASTNPAPTKLAPPPKPVAPLLPSAPKPSAPPLPSAPKPAALPLPSAPKPAAPPLPSAPRHAPHLTASQPAIPKVKPKQPPRHPLLKPATQRPISRHAMVKVSARDLINEQTRFSK